MSLTQAASVLRSPGRRLRRHRFRKACRSRFPAHPLVVQRVGENPRTSTEGPFGEVLHMTGPMAKVNPFQFSTKFDDDETDFLYYGYRYYNPSTGRWLSRDPIGEIGGLPLYCLLSNDGLDSVDRLGLRQPPDGWMPVPPYHPASEGQPCCCSPSATVDFRLIDDGSKGWRRHHTW